MLTFFAYRTLCTAPCPPPRSPGWAGHSAGLTSTPKTGFNLNLNKEGSNSQKKEREREHRNQTNRQIHTLTIKTHRTIFCVESL